MTGARPFTALLAGCGAIGSRFEAAYGDLKARLAFADRDRVGRENLAVAAFDEEDLGHEKAAVLAQRRRRRAATGWSLCGDVRYTVRPGLVEAIDAAVLCLDNPTAIRDAAETLWAVGSAELPVLALTCGGDRGGYLARLFLRPGLCPVCLFGEGLHRADRQSFTTSCVDTTAPRASAAAAEAAAWAGAELLAKWRWGDRSPANCRVQCDAVEDRVLVIRMPSAPSPRCPVSHQAVQRYDLVELGGSTRAASVGTLAGRAIAALGNDARIDLGRRAVPLRGIYCSGCRRVTRPPKLLMPAALQAGRSCRCAQPLLPVGQGHTVAAVELLSPALASLSLAAWGAGHGDEFVARGRRGAVRLRCAFDWRELDEA
jgi:molybdopterin/thiamine biosynthesis adenylyltransferase